MMYFNIKKTITSLFHVLLSYLNFLTSKFYLKFYLTNFTIIILSLLNLSICFLFF